MDVRKLLEKNDEDRSFPYEYFRSIQLDAYRRSYRAVNQGTSIMYDPINTITKTSDSCTQLTFTITDLRGGASSIRKTIVRGHFAPLSTIALLAPL